VILEVVDRGRQLAAQDVFDPYVAHGGHHLHGLATVGDIARRPQPTSDRAVYRSTSGIPVTLVARPEPGRGRAGRAARP
jgi:hypothetical protein